VRREIAFLKDEILFSTPYQALVSASGSGAGGGSTLMTQEEAFYIQTILLQHSGFLDKSNVFNGFKNILGAECRLDSILY